MSNYPSGINHKEAPWNRPEVKQGWSVQYYRGSLGWVEFKEYRNEEEAFADAGILAKGLHVRIVDPQDGIAWRSDCQVGGAA